VDDSLHGIEVIVRGGNAEAADLVRSIALREGRPGLWIGGINAIPAEHAALPPAHRVVLDLTAEHGTPDELAFRAKTYLTDLRGSAPSVRLGIHASAEVLDRLRDSGIAAYIDFEARATPDIPPFPLPATAGQVLAVHETGSGATTSGRWIVPLPPDPGLAAAIVRDVSVSAPVLVDGLVRGGMVDVRCGTRRVPTYLNPESLETVVLGPACAGAAYAADPASPIELRATLANGYALMTVAAPQGGFAEGVSVVGTRRLSVREVIARHQAAAARQRREVRELISSGQMTLTFEAPGFPAPVTISTEAVLYASGGVLDVEQRDVRVNGIAFSRDAVPRLPLLEPERVVSPPLAIALNDAYRYELDADADAGGVRCYVVRFEPVDARRPLFRGRAWIAADDFSMVKVAAVQTGLRGAIVSSEQTDEFRRQRPGVWLLARSEVHQIYEGAGHRTPIHRVLAVQRHEINPPAFSARRQAAYASPSIMLRDTPDGFRYLVRKPAEPGATTTAEPTVAGRAERVRTLAVGLILDPNINRPLPFAGLSYIDFDLLGTGTQMNGFFGGTYGQLAIAVPSLGGTRWQLGGRAFGIASSYNDRAFVDGREIYAANVSQRPAHASTWLLRPLSARLGVRVGYEFDYTAYGRVDSTSPSFEVPAAQAAHSLRLGLEGQWSGWAASVWWAGARRSGWRRWGEAGGEYRPGHGDFQRFGGTISRSFVASPRVVGRVEAAFMDGHDLDRFSRYSFGSFENRLRGYPSALVRYDAGGVLRTAIAWSATRFLRFDGFADAARVRDPGFGGGFRSYPGIGAAAEIPAPFGTLVAVEWGYGFQGLDTEGRRGTQVVRISGYKMF
jgi:hypothetical protein